MSSAKVVGGGSPGNELSSGAIAQRLRDTLRHLLKQHDDNRSVSLDQYFDRPRYHAMADGKFLSALAQGRQAEAVGFSWARGAVKRALGRLERHSLASGEHACWGLNFPYKETGPKEPFLITTAIVTLGLLQIGDLADPKLLERAVRWLDDYPWRTAVEWEGQSLELPHFSPNTPVVVNNALAAWAATLELAHRRMELRSAPMLRPVSQYLMSRCVEPVGWPYAPGNERVDLLHGCYIVNSLLDLSPSPRLHAIALRMVSCFQGAGCVLDKLDVADEAAAIGICQRSAGCSLMPLGDRWAVRYHEEARPWTYGELLVLLSRLAVGGGYRGYWRAQMLRLAALLADRIAAAASKPPLLRDTMHVAHGLAWCLSVLRHAHERGESVNA